ncbi:MAG: AAA family ATPase [Bradymonadia bacterium]
MTADAPASDLSTRFNALGQWLKGRFIERDDTVDAALCALVAGQHVLLVGPPGTAKSQLAAGLCDAIEGAQRFQWLLTRFTTPEELFGPVSLKSLEIDRYQRLTAGKLPESHVVFLDEVFKASSAILNTLLTVLNERKFHNGLEAQPVPLLTLFGAANELPEDDDLLALYDRFLVRLVVDYVEEDFRFLKLLGLDGQADDPPALTLDEIHQAQADAQTLDVPQDVLYDVVALRAGLKERGITVSDRRWRQCLGLMRAQAWLQGRPQVSSTDLRVLRHTLWSSPDERDEVKAALDQIIDGELSELRRLVAQAREIHTYPERYDDDDARARAALEALTKLKALARAASEIADRARRRGRDPYAIKQAVDEIVRLRDVVARAHLKEPLQ